MKKNYFNIMLSAFVTVMLLFASCEFLSDSDSSTNQNSSENTDGTTDTDNNTDTDGNTGGDSSDSDSGSAGGDLNVSDIITKTSWDSFFPERWGVGSTWDSMYGSKYDAVDLYSYDNLSAAIDELSNIQLKVSSTGSAAASSVITVSRKDTRISDSWVELYSYGWVDYTYEAIVNFNEFCNKPGASEEDTNREFAAFLANISHETGYSDDIGLFYREEVAYEGVGTTAYSDSSSWFVFQPVAGQSYHGRGPIQLSWNYNYGYAGECIYGDGNTTLLTNPDTVKEDGKLAFMTAIWFWMLPQPAKPSCHEVMYSDFTANSNQRNVWGFGHTALIINGGLEGNGAMKERRLTFYKKFAGLLGVSIGENGEVLNTDGLVAY
ncbi:MAG: chitinase [Spirochaetales bacterium]